MAEQVEGSFTFTVLDEGNNWYLVKGDNPMCIYHFPRRGLYLYASTEEILVRALSKMRIGFRKPRKIKTTCGDILKISPKGVISQGKFDTSSFLSDWPIQYGFYTGCIPRSRKVFQQEHLDEVKSVAASFGYSPESIDDILAQGFTLDEVEEFLYCGRI